MGYTKAHVDVMKSGVIVLHVEDGMAIAGIKIHCAEDARDLADALLKAADSVEACGTPQE